MPEILIPLKIQKLEEGTYLATSEMIQGLIAEGRTIAETMKIAQDVARNIIESCIEYGDPLPSTTNNDAEPMCYTSIPIEIEA